MPRQRAWLKFACQNGRFRAPIAQSKQIQNNFQAENLLPRKYLMVITTHMDVGGIYNIYVNDVLVTTFDYYTFVRLKGLNWSVTGKRYINTGRYNKFDCFVESITNYGTANIKIEYAGPSSMIVTNGLAIDCIEFIPWTE